MLKEAQALKEEGKEDAFLSEKLFGAPLTAYRFLSLAGRLTDDDMFSVDLMKEGLETILSPMRQHETSWDIMRHSEVSWDIRGHCHTPRDIVRQHKTQWDITATMRHQWNETSWNILRHHETFWDIMKTSWSLDTTKHHDVLWCPTLSHDVSECLMFSWCQDWSQSNVKHFGHHRQLLMGFCTAGSDYWTGLLFSYPNILWCLDEGLPAVTYQQMSTVYATKYLTVSCIPSIGYVPIMFLGMIPDIYWWYSTVWRIVLRDNGCDLRRARIWLVTSSFSRSDNSMVAAWPDPSSLCEGCGLWDYEWCGRPRPPPPHTHTHTYICWWDFLKSIIWLASFPGLCPPMHEPGNEAIIWYTKL